MEMGHREHHWAVNTETLMTKFGRFWPPEVVICIFSPQTVNQVAHSRAYVHG